jgi:PAS domain S-box-containing protein
MNAPSIEYEAARIHDLLCHEILDTPPETSLDELSALAAAICETPVALISLVDTSRLWLKSRIGLDITELPRDGGFCSYAILEPDIFIVTDALEDQRFVLNPLVAGAPGLRFYAGVPLLVPAGYRLGTLCVLDRVPRQLSASQQEALITLSRQVVTQLELRLNIVQLERTRAERSMAEDELGQREHICRAALDALSEHIAVLDSSGAIIATNEAWNQFARTNGDHNLCHTGVGSNYLTVCQASIALGATTADPKIVADAKAATAVDTNLRRILDGTQNQFTYEYPCHSDAEKRWFSLIATSLRQPCTGAVIAHTDITHQKLADFAASVQARLLEAVQQTIIVTDLVGNIRYWNRFAETCFGWSSAEVMAHNVIEIMALQYSSEQARDILHCLHTGRSWSGEFLVRNRGGTTFPMLIINSPVYDDHGSLAGMIGIWIDITERRRAETASRIHMGQQKTIVDLGLLALSPISLADLIDHMVVLVAQMLSSDYCNVLELLPDSKSFLIGAGVGWNDGIVGYKTISIEDDTYVSYIWSRPEPIIIDDLSTERRFQSSDLLKEHTVTSGVSLIIPGHDRPYGILSVYTTHHRTFTGDDVNFLRAITNVLTEAIERKRRERYLEALVTVTATLRVASTRDEMLAIILNNVQALLESEGAALILRDPHSSQGVVEYALGRWSGTKGTRVLSEIGSSARIIARQSPEIEDPPDPNLHGVPAELPIGNGAAACIPLIAKDEVIGNLWVCCQKNISEDELSILTSIGTLAANAIHRSSLHERTVDLVHQLHNQEGFITRIVESTPSSLVVFDRALRVVLVNRNFLEKSHREKHATQGHKIDEIFPPVLLEYTRLDLKVREVFRTGQAIDGDKLAYRTPGISTHIYYYRLVPLKIEEHVENVLLFMDDITEREHLGEELRRIERHLASVVNSANDLVLSLNVDGSIMTWNRAAARISGLSADVAHGQMLLELVPDNQRGMMGEMLDALCHGATVQRTEINLLTSQSQVIPIAWSCSPMLTDEGEVTGMVAIGRDLTEQRRLEAQLIQSTKMASLGVMAGGIAHELRNPLGIISASAQLLQDHHHDTNLCDQCTTKIHDATKRASLIIDNLLKFARPMSVHMQLLDINVVIEDTFVLMTHQLVLQQISLIKHLTADLPQVYGNSALLQQVFTNLILNACNAMSQAGSLTVTTRANSVNMVEIRFTDTGCGITSEAQPKIFDPFFTTRPIGKGTGLGLSISYTIIQQHRGEIAVQSTVGQGTTFTVSLPVVNGAAITKQ